jgi:hypothetical protein
MTFDAISIQFFGHIGKFAWSIGKLATRMTAVAKGTGDALPMNLVLFPQFIGTCMTSLTFGGIVGRVADEDEDEVDA